MRRVHGIFLAAAFLFAFCLPLGAQAQESRNSAARSRVDSDPGNDGDSSRVPVFAQVVIYDVAPNLIKEFEAALLSTQELALAEQELINERVLRNIDDLTMQYATYSKFLSRNAAEKLMQARLKKVQPFCLREPEIHLAALTHAYTLDGSTNHPTGLELGNDRVGQIAHLGLFVPYPKFRAQYDQTLHEVKLVLQARKSPGYIGEEIAAEVDLLAPKLQTPYSPRAFEASRMSVNYGEYDTMENAENGYVTRHSSNDPKIVHLERNFFSALQVPTRFYLFQVIGNYGHPNIAKKGSQQQTIRKAGND